MARYLVLAPMPVELRPVVRSMGLRSADGGTHRGTVGGAEVAAVLAGIGPRAAERAARRSIGALVPTHVLVVGVAGGVRPDLAIGSLVVPATVQAVDDADPTLLGPARSAHALGGVALEGALITTRDLITERAVHDAHQAQGIDAVDMETAAIAAVCDELDLPWTAFRGISDHVDEGLLADPAIVGLLGPDGAPRPAAAAKAVLRRPTILRSFVRLGVGSTKATRAAARGATQAIEEDAATS